MKLENPTSNGQWTKNCRGCGKCVLAMADGQKNHGWRQKPAGDAKKCEKEKKVATKSRLKQLGGAQKARGQLYPTLRHSI